jgi:hypothetical protein
MQGTWAETGGVSAPDVDAVAPALKTGGGRSPKRLVLVAFHPMNVWDAAEPR